MAEQRCVLMAVVNALLVHTNVTTRNNVYLEFQDCSRNSTGAHCELCIDGTYDADPSLDLSCNICPCSTATATKSV